MKVTINTKELEYKRMISRIKAIGTYFKNQMDIAETTEDKLFTTAVYDTMLDTLEKAKKSYKDIYGVD